MWATLHLFDGRPGVGVESWNRTLHLAGLSPDLAVKVVRYADREHATGPKMKWLSIGSSELGTPHSVFDQHACEKSPSSLVDLDRAELLNQLPWTRQRGVELAFQVWRDARSKKLTDDAMEDPASSGSLDSANKVCETRCTPQSHTTLTRTLSNCYSLSFALFFSLSPAPPTNTSTQPVRALPNSRHAHRRLQVIWGRPPR